MTADVVPSDWRVVCLGDLATDMFGGGTPSTKHPEYWDGDQPWTTSAIIKPDDIHLDKCQRWVTREGLKNSSSKVAPKGSILIGTRVGVGKAVVTLLDIAINQDLTALIPSGDVVSEFLVLMLKQQSIQRWFESNKRGSTIKGVPRTDLANIAIPLPPLPEQRAIAEVLRTVQRAKEATEKVIAACRQLKQSLMRHLFTYGPVPFDQADKVALKETEIGPMPEHWQVVPIGQFISRGPQNGLYRPQTHYGSGTLIVRIDDYPNEGGIVCKAANRVRLTSEESDSYGLNEADILVNRVNSLSHIGKAALIGHLTEPLVFESNMMRFSVAPSDSSAFVYRFLTTSLCREQFRGKAKRAVAQSSINQGDVKTTLMPRPDVTVQEEIAANIAVSDTMLKAEKKRHNALTTLFDTLLHHLMTGKVRVV